MENYILISQLNDFVFCPLSIYFHNTYQTMEKKLYQGKAQTHGSRIHESIDESSYSTRKDILTGLEIISEKYHLIGKIDLYHARKKELVERKAKVIRIYDGYIYQLYAQCFAMREMGYAVNSLKIISYQDNKQYPIALPEQDLLHFQQFEHLIATMQNFDLKNFQPINHKKCQSCIYEPACDRSINHAK